MKNFRDDELEKWLAKEYYREADEMEKILFPDGNIPEYEETEEESRAAYAKLVERLKADGVYEEEDNSDRADEYRKISESIQFSAKGRNRFAHVAAVAVICIAGVFAASMTSQANRSYFIDSVKLWTGNDTSISVDNDSESDEADKNEQSALDDIKNTLNIELIPKFIYRPAGFEFKSYKVNKEGGYALIEYNCNNAIISVFISDYGDNSKNSEHLLDGKMVKTIKAEDEKINIKIIEIKAENDVEENYAACWNDKDVFYQVSGKMNRKEFVKLIEKMRF